MIRITTFLILLFSMSFVAEEQFQYPPGKKGKLDIQGHRGCRGLMPENTIPAMMKAIDLGVTTLEMDVVITKDKKVLLSHEPWFSHEITTKADGSFIPEEEERKFNIFRMTYEEVKSFDVGIKPHSRFPQQQKIKAIKPLLGDLIDSVENYLAQKNLQKVQYNIETKCLPAGDKLFHPEPTIFIELIMDVIKDKKMEERVIIQSFDFRTLKYLHEKYPSIKTAMLIEDSEDRSFEDQLKALGYIPPVYSPNYTMVDKEMIKACHEKGMKIIPWTVNDNKEFRKLKKMGVDGLITDFPDLIKN